MSAALPDDAGAAALTRAEPEPEPVPASQRLAESRERMRQWMLHADGRHEARRRAAAARAEGEQPAWIDRLRSHAVLGTVIDAISAWWANHPLHPAVGLANTVVRDAVAPLARRHPLATLASAFVVGGAIAWFRPWRWIIKPALFAGLASQVVTRLVTAMPLDSLLNAMASFAQARGPEPTDAGEGRAAGAAAPTAEFQGPTAERPTVH